MSKPILHGTTCHAGGRSIEICSKHPEWTAWAVEKLYLAEQLEKAAASGDYDLIIDGYRYALVRGGAA